MSLSANQFFDRIETSKNLPSLPHILIKLIEVCNKEESDAKEISQVIKKDSSLSAKVMRMVNSSYYSLPKKVTDIEHALVLLGIDAIKNITISASVYQAFKKPKDNSIFNLKKFWWHSLMCATLSKLIAIKTLYSSHDEAFLSGLLHDMGKLVLLVNFSKQYKQVLQSAKDQQDLLLAGETRLGATHSEVGAWMINRWNLQSFISDAVLYHHESTDRILEALPLVKIIYVANVLCPETNKENDVRLDIAKRVFGFSRAEVEELTLQAKDEVEQTAKSLNIEIEPPEVSGEAVSEKDLEKQEELLREVKDISLLQGMLQNLLKAHDEDSILQVVHQGLQVLFDAKIVFFFVYNPERDILIGKNIWGDEHDNLINEVTIPFQKGKSILLKSLLQETPLDSFSYSKEEALTIIDSQIIRIIGKEGMLCLPMVAQKQYIGAIIIGLDEAHVSHFYKQIKLLTMFTDQAAIALHANNLSQNQAKVMQSQRLTASSALARKVVHEVNTPLSIIKNYLKIMERKLEPEDLGQDALRVINEEVNRVALLLRELADFSEPKVQPTDPLDINALLSDIIKVFQETLLLKPNVGVHLELEPSLPQVITDKNRLKQVFMNLIHNAIDAMPEGGNLNIKTGCALNSQSGKLLPNLENALSNVEVLINDDGSGISDAIKSRLYEPFITSKGEGHAGLGLSIVYNIVKELNGDITCKSDKTNGTTFKIVLPVVQTLSC